jgi:diguanylate cyclase (GGDEF)-like protein
MTRVYAITFLVGSGAMLFALLLIHTLVPIMGETIQPSMYISSFVGSYSIGCPVAYYMAMQNRRLAQVLGELERTHRELEAAHERLHDKARRDPMTGFFNREHFFEEAARLRQTEAAGTLLIVDADHFKQINDRWGHLKGDEALHLISAAIASSLRKSDVVGRIGGEEFCVFLPGTTGQVAMSVAERIRESVERIEFRPDGETLWPLSVSLGGAAAPAGPTMSQLMRAADLRLYEAKRTGRNRTLMTAELVQAA